MTAHKEIYVALDTGHSSSPLRRATMNLADRRPIGNGGSEVIVALLTEHRPVDDLIVYGYLRTTSTHGGRLRVLSEVLAEYCHHHELALGGVFVERPDVDAPSGPAFTGLLDVLQLQKTYGVILPSPCHLGPRRIAVARMQQINAAGPACSRFEDGQFSH